MAGESVRAIRVNPSPTLATLPLQSGVQIVYRQQPWRVWRKFVTIIFLGYLPILALIVWRFGASSILFGSELLWPAWVIAIGLSACGVLSLEFIIEPRRIRISSEGIRYSNGIQDIVFRWDQIRRARRTRFGYGLQAARPVVAVPKFLRRFQTPPNRTPMQSFVPSPAQWRAILSHPSFPKIPVPVELPLEITESPIHGSPQS